MIKHNVLLMGGALFRRPLQQQSYIVFCFFDVINILLYLFEIIHPKYLLQCHLPGIQEFLSETANPQLVAFYAFLASNK